MSDNLIKLAPREAQPHADVVATLEKALQMARAGEIVSVAIAAALPGRSTATIYWIGYGEVAPLYLACMNLAERVRLHEDP